ncbi:CDP-archaeol synthase [Marinobacter salinexigens]|uniref:CDP-archaeol synthase n=1 Tax=Marinobacter salinexigens TaxID=2919747 RepID=A0A5B0VNJ0_9GAMM|nr:CDP-archaeol synthase [Marinobacter salinexigens]KAA1175765.1 CDP-archaeol synthase [Marinobacter salinexigens]
MLIPFELFVMLVLANGAPVVVAKVLKNRWAAPVDGGRLWADGRPVLGRSKTWRGLIAGIITCALFSLVTGLGLIFGALFGLLALLGDIVSSFVKRRLGLLSSGRAVGLDQIPEALLPMILAMFWLPLSVLDGLLIVALFTLSNIYFSPILYRLGIRRHPH